MDRVDNRDLLDLQVQMGISDLLVTPGQLGILDHPDNKEAREILVNLDPVVPQDLQVSRV